MSYPSKRFEFEAATPADGPEILNILESNPFHGKVSLLFTRREDAYHSFMKEGEEVELLVCRDRRENKIAGFGAYVIRELYVNAECRRVAYIFGLRANGSYLRSFPLLNKAYEYLYQRCQKKNVDLFVTTILNENHSTRSLLEKKRSYMPSYEARGDYEVFALKTCRKKNQLKHVYFRKAQKNDIGEIVQFLNQEGRNYQLFPVLKEEDLTGENFAGLNIEDFYIVHDQTKTILAAGAVWDQRAYKQYIVKGYSGIVHWFNQLNSWLRLGSPTILPKPGTTLNFFTLSFWAVRGNQKAMFNFFLENISQENSEYPFFVVGMERGHPLRPALKRRPHVSYKSRLYAVDWNKNPGPSRAWDKNLGVYLECGLL